MRYLIILPLLCYVAHAQEEKLLSTVIAIAGTKKTRYDSKALWHSNPMGTVALQHGSRS